MRNNRGITLISLIAYIILSIIVIGMLTALSVHFRNNLSVVTESSAKDAEFDKLNLQLLKEMKTEDNLIDTDKSTSTKLVFANGNTYTYVSGDKIVYMNSNIKVAENLSSCTFEALEENNRQKLNVAVEINGITRRTNYVGSAVSNYITATDIEADPNTYYGIRVYGYDPNIAEDGSEYNQTYAAGYDPSFSDDYMTGDCIFTSDYDGGWYVLGVQNGQLLITTETPVYTTDKGDEFDFYDVTNGVYVFGLGYPYTLNEAVKLYARGRYADLNVEGRNIEVADLGLSGTLLNNKAELNIQYPLLKNVLNGSSGNYFLPDKPISTTCEPCGFTMPSGDLYGGLMYVSSDGVVRLHAVQYDCPDCGFSGWADCVSGGIRPVVTLKSNIKLELDENSNSLTIIGYSE